VFYKDVTGNLECDIARSKCLQKWEYRLDVFIGGNFEKPDDVLLIGFGA